MICPDCARAADQQLPRDAHCTSQGGPGAKCPCQHRTEQYRTTSKEN